MSPSSAARPSGASVSRALFVHVFPRFDLRKMIALDRIRKFCFYRSAFISASFQTSSRRTRARTATSTAMPGPRTDSAAPTRITCWSGAANPASSADPHRACETPEVPRRHLISLIAFFDIPCLPSSPPPPTDSDMPAATFSVLDLSLNTLTVCGL